MPTYKADPNYEPGTLKPKHGTDWALPRFRVPALPTEAYRQGHEATFGEVKRFCDGCGKRFAWCECNGG